MSEAELDEAVQAVITELQLEPVMKNKGMLIKEMMARYKMEKRMENRSTPPSAAHCMPELSDSQAGR